MSGKYLYCLIIFLATDLKRILRREMAHDSCLIESLKQKKNLCLDLSIMRSVFDKYYI